MGRRAEVVARARALVGAPFRLQGRSVETGLDCVGVAMMATGSDPRRVRRNYGLRTGNPDDLHDEFDACGFQRLAPNQAEPGDLVVVRAGPAQLHILLVTDIGFLHADARLRRVVEVPGSSPWPLISAWRCPDDGVVAVRLR